MPKTTIAVEQTIWDCRWSLPGLLVCDPAERSQPQPLWVCIRTGERRPVSEAACTNCPHWEREDARWN